MANEENLRWRNGNTKEVQYRPGIFQHGHAGFEPTVLFGVFEHVFRNPVFHGSLRYCIKQKETR